MKTVLHIFTRDLIRILKNPIAIIVTIGVCIIPSLYAWFNIAANWDPYKNTQTMPVAVVSEDIGAEVGDQGYLNAGSMVIDKLKDNTQLQWTFVSSKEEALEGVSAGTYYAAIILPKDFTSDLASVLSGNLKKAPVQYYVNEKINPVAPKVTDTGAKTITTQINETFVSKVSEVVSEKFIGLASTVSSQTDTATDRVSADLHDTGNDFKKISGTIEASQSTLKDARTTLAQAQKTLDTLIESADKASGTLSDITSQLPKIKQDANTLSAKLFSSLIEGGTSISGISSHADAAVGQITGSVGSAMGTVDGTVASVQSLVSTNRQLVDDLKTIRDSLPAAHQSSFDTLIDELDASVSQEEALLARLQTASGDIHASNDSLSHLSSTMNTTVNTNIDAIHQTVQTLSTTSIPEFNGSIDSFGDATYTLNATLSATKPALQQIKGTLNQLDHVLSQAQDATLRTEDSLSTTAKTLDTLSSDMNVIKNSQLMEQLQKVVNLNPKDIASFMSSPVKIEDDIVYPVANYGSSVTPFYTNLALWVGGIVLIAIYKLEVDHENIGSFAPWQGYFGRWLLMMLLAILQATICCIGDLLLKIQCVSPTAFILAGIIEAVVYVTLIYSLSIAFKHIGKALCVLLVILQIPGAAGLYPIEMMPGFFQAIHPWLPFTYGIAAMREAIGGFYGNFYLENLVKVSLFIIPAFVVGVVLRRHLLNINYLFDRRLAATGLMAHERDGIKIEHYRLSSLMHALQNSDEYTRDVEVRAQRFESRYPSRIRYGLRALIALPIGLLVVLFISQNKLFWLIVWIIAIVVTCAYLIIIEYLHETMRRRKSMTGLDTSRMVKMIGTQLEREERGE
ncbi:YhgE/Pip family protein [Lancefieldella rimae]